MKFGTLMFTMAIFIMVSLGMFMFLTEMMGNYGTTIEPQYSTVYNQLNSTYKDLYSESAGLQKAVEESNTKREGQSGTTTTQEDAFSLTFKSVLSTIITAPINIVKGIYTTITVYTNTIGIPIFVLNSILIMITLAVSFGILNWIRKGD